MSKDKPARQKQVHRDGVQLLIEKKARSFVAAERSYWEAISALRQQRHEVAESLALPFESTLPQSISSTVWGLIDGAAFVRHKTIGSRAGVEFRILPWTLEQWSKEGLIVPLEGGDFAFARARIFGGLGNICFINFQADNVHVPYAEFAHLRYGESSNIPSVESAVLDFQLTLLGLQTQQDHQTTRPIESAQTITILQQMADTFEGLLNEETKEEELQIFLKQHSFMLHPSAECIPKQKLGEDFVTDFVLVATSMQGPSYIFVEIEHASHPVLTKDLTLSSAASHAIRQVHDWDVWLESNKSYIQNRLPGFETPTYMVVIGHGHRLSDVEKCYLRSYNRDWKNTCLLTYDDVLSRFRSTIANLAGLTVAST